MSAKFGVTAQLLGDSENMSIVPVRDERRRVGYSISPSLDDIVLIIWHCALPWLNRIHHATFEWFAQPAEAWIGLCAWWQHLRRFLPTRADNFSQAGRIAACPQAGGFVSQQLTVYAHLSD